MKGEHYPPKCTRKEENIHEISLQDRANGQVSLSAVRVDLFFEYISEWRLFVHCLCIVSDLRHLDMPICQHDISSGHAESGAPGGCPGLVWLALLRSESPLQSRQTVGLIGRRRPISFPSSLLQPLAVSRAVFACDGRCECLVKFRPQVATERGMELQ